MAYKQDVTVNWKNLMNALGEKNTVFGFLTISEEDKVAFFSNQLIMNYD